MGSVVIGGQRPLGGLGRGQLRQVHAAMARRGGGDPGEDAFSGAAAVAVEVELALEVSLTDHGDLAVP